MTPKILPVSDRGQITLPKKIRDKIQTRFFTCEISEGTIVLKPMKTREDFFAELEAAEKDWEKNGGITLEELIKEHNLNL